MKSYTVCYLIRDDKILMLYRNKKEVDINKGKWIGVGGKIELGESPHESVKREVTEETGYILNECILRGMLIFMYNGITEYIYVFTSEDFSGEIITCDEGDLKYIPKQEILDLNIWEGDKYFLKDIIDDKKEFFVYRMEYENDKLIDVKKEQ
ncbi:NUDIX hydrolase [Streptobacillus moniliformis]|uniref:NUDIX hydrolase n=1 Tax=Streptobacillus moniliformis TaxID=34105 RepID=UPI0007E3E109|nr:8-oxo-dGTP diphosphatase [Streptobacillus moniliformis]